MGTERLQVGDSVLSQTAENHLKRNQKTTQGLRVFSDSSHSSRSCGLPSQHYRAGMAVHAWNPNRKSLASQASFGYMKSHIINECVVRVSGALSGAVFELHAI